MQILRQVNVYMSIYYCICLFNNLHHDSVFMSVAYLFDLNKGTLLFFLQNKHTHTHTSWSLTVPRYWMPLPKDLSDKSVTCWRAFLLLFRPASVVHAVIREFAYMAGGKKSSSYQTGALQYSYSPLFPFINKIINHQVWNVLKL